MSILKWQEEVFERLRKGLPKTRIFLEGVPESSKVPIDPTGLVRPMVIVWFGQITESEGFGSRESGDLCGVPECGISPGSMNLAAEVVAPSGLALLHLENSVRRLLTGFSPAGRGQLREGGVATIRDPLPVGVGPDLRFYKPLFFSGRIDQ